MKLLRFVVSTCLHNVLIILNLCGTIRNDMLTRSNPPLDRSWMDPFDVPPRVALNKWGWRGETGLQQSIVAKTQSHSSFQNILRTFCQLGARGTGTCGEIQWKSLTWNKLTWRNRHQLQFSRGTLSQSLFLWAIRVDENIEIHKIKRRELNKASVTIFCCPGRWSLIGKLSVIEPRDFFGQKSHEYWVVTEKWSLVLELDSSFQQQSLIKKLIQQDVIDQDVYSKSQGIGFETILNKIFTTDYPSMCHMII